MEKLPDTKCETTILTMLQKIKVGLKNFNTRNQELHKVILKI